jgi:putative ABC transport system substrate-binding protein
MLVSAAASSYRGVAVWPLAARAQQRERMRRIAVLMSIAADDPEGQTRPAAFQQGLQQLGWTNGRSVEIATRWGARPHCIRTYAAELPSNWSSIPQSPRR